MSTRAHTVPKFYLNGFVAPESERIEKQLNKIENSHQFSRAVSIGNPREFTQAEKQEQEVAEGCKRLIKNAITCWNYLYLSQKISEVTGPEAREILFQAIASG